MTSHADLIAALKWNGSLNSVTVGTTGITILGPSPKRVALLFFSSPSGHYSLSTSPGLTYLGPNTVTIAQFSSVIVLPREWIGNIITKPWYAIGSAASQTVSWIEVIDDEDYL
jgi:hypothetical protein